MPKCSTDRFSSPTQASTPGKTKRADVLDRMIGLEVKKARTERYLEEAREMTSEERKREIAEAKLRLSQVEQAEAEAEEEDEIVVD